MKRIVDVGQDYIIQHVIGTPAYEWDNRFWGKGQGKLSIMSQKLYHIK